MDSRVDFSDDILAYLRNTRGQLVPMLVMVTYMTRRICLSSRVPRSEPVRRIRRRVRGMILSDVSRLVREGKVIRYRKITMVTRKGDSSQGLLRISELAA